MVLLLLVGPSIGCLLVGLQLLTCVVPWNLPRVIEGETALERHRLSPQYRLRLRQGLDHFLSWAAAKNVNIETLEVTSAANRILAYYVQDCYAGGISISLSKHAVLAVQMRFPQLKRAISRPWDGLRTWARELPHSHRTPLPEEVLKALFGITLEAALHRQFGLVQLVVVVLWRIAFYGLLRPGEVMNLRRGDLKFSCLNGVWLLIVGIRDPKTRHIFGRDQFALVKDQGTILWAHALFQHFPLMAKLWPSSRQRMVSMFQGALERLGLGRIGFTLGSFRPGGTTCMFLLGQDVPRIKYAGRWSSESSLLCYIQECMAHLVWAQFSTEIESDIRIIVVESEFAWNSPPPARHLSRLFGRWLLSRQRKRRTP